MATKKEAAPKKLKEPKVKIVRDSESGSEEVNDAHVYKGKELIRTFTREEHGDEFARLAIQFAAKIDGTVE